MNRKFVKPIATLIITVLTLLMLFFGANSAAFAQSQTQQAKPASGFFDLGGNTSDEAKQQAIKENSDARNSFSWSFLPGIPNEGDFVDNVNSVLDRAAGIVRLAIATVALLMGTIGVARMVTSRGEQDEYDKGIMTLIYGVAGIFLIALSGDIAAILSPYNGGLLGADLEVRARTLIFDNGVRTVITFIKYFAGTVAVAMLVRIGFRMVAFGGNDDDLGQDKKNIGFIALGLILLIFGDSLIRNIFYKVDSPLAAKPTIDISGAMLELISFTNLIVKLVGPIAVITLVAGGLMYVLSGVNEELKDQGVKMIKVSLIGIILLYSAFGIVNTAIIGRF